MPSNLMNWIPKRYREAISDAYRDQDGIWVCIKEGWTCDETVCGSARTIHEDDLKRILECVKTIKKSVSKDVT